MDRQRLRKIVVETVLAFEGLPYVVTGVSNRHIHLSREDADILFGAGYELTVMKPLYQPGEFACEETLRAVGPKGKIDKVRILGPSRAATQIELSLTDTFTLGVQCPVNLSGNLAQAGKIRLENPSKGTFVERNCGIVAMRHIHLTPQTAGHHGLKDRQIVSLEYGEGLRAITFGGVLLRVSPSFADEAHLDTDEANAGAIKTGDFGLIIP